MLNLDRCPRRFFRFFQKSMLVLVLVFLNNGDVGEDFEYSTKIALQGKSVRVIVRLTSTRCVQS